MKLLTFTLIGLLCCGSCGKREAKIPQPKDQVTVTVSRKSIGDFRHFLEALSLLVQRDSVVVLNREESGDRAFGISSLRDFPGCGPLAVHVAPGTVAIGTGAGRAVVSLEELGKSMALSAEAANSAGTKAIVLVIADRGVTGDFGFSVLDVLGDSGIGQLLLCPPDPKPEQLRTEMKKPSSPAK